jgi:hypothetical protein
MCAAVGRESRKELDARPPSVPIGGREAYALVRPSDSILNSRLAAGGCEQATVPMHDPRRI